MEHKIGQIVTLPDGRKAEVVEGYCKDCIHHNTLWVKCLCGEMDYAGQCGGSKRDDHKSIIYKEIKEE